MLTRRGRRRLGVLIAGAATLIAADFAFGLSTQPDAHALGIGATGTLALLPASLLAWGSVHFGQYFPAGVHTVNGVTFSGGDEYGSDMVLNSTLALTILLCMAFAARYAWRLATRSAPAPEPAAEVPVFGRPLAPRWVRLAAVPLGLIGAGVWIYSTAFADTIASAIRLAPSCWSTEARSMTRSVSLSWSLPWHCCWPGARRCCRRSLSRTWFQSRPNGPCCRPDGPSPGWLHRRRRRRVIRSRPARLQWL